MAINKINKLTTSLILLSLIGTSIFLSINNTNINGYNIYSMKNIEQIFKLNTSGVLHYINLDGVIDDAEWATAQHKTEFWLNVDDNHADGNNYLYLGEDEDNLYVALDLCSDNTTDETGEWIGLWLNTDKSIFANIDEWANNLENGAESLMHDVENDNTWPFFNESEPPSGVKYNQRLNDISEINVVNGTLSGDLSDLDSYDSNYMNLNSEPYISNHITRLDFEINISKFFLPNALEELYLENINHIEINFRSRISTGEAITSNKIVVWYSNGTYNLNDPNQVVDINRGTSFSWDNVIFGGGNLTADKIMKFSIFGNHSSAFTHDLEYLVLDVYTPHINSPGPSGIPPYLFPYTSINNYEIKWSFGPSSNNATDHRMFEIIIPKSELQHYETDEELGIMVAGYGTMSFEELGYWVFSQPPQISLAYSDSNKYIYYNMNMKPFNPPDAFVLSSDAGVPDTDGAFNLNWDSSNGADNYSIYTHDSLITEINESITLLDEGLTNNSIPISGLAQGDYYYVAIAHNETGYYTSNCLKIKVVFPCGPFTLDTDAENPDLDGAFNLTWTTSENAEYYSVYMYDNVITELNSSITIVEDGLTILTRAITELDNGIYYFIVIAYNEAGHRMSNYISVNVGTGGGGGPIVHGYEPYFIIAIISVITFVSIWRKKQFKNE